MRASGFFGLTLVALVAILGSYYVVMPYADATSCPASGCTVGGDTLNVSVTPSTGSSPLLVSYKAYFSGNSIMKSATWNFGDGVTATNVMNGTHTYASAGNFTGSVEVDATDGMSYSQSFQISVTGAIGATIGANATIPYDKNGTAYEYLLHEHNNTLAATSQAPLTLQTDATSYSQGDSIIIHGAVKNVSNQTAVTLRIINPLSNMVKIDQLIPNPDGTFTTNISGHQILATGPLWTKAGNYTIIAQYGPATNATTSFYFAGVDGTSKISAPPTSSTFTLQTTGGTFSIPYTIRGGTVSNIQIQGEQHVLVVTISATSDGSLSIDLPRALIDSKQQITAPTGTNTTSTTSVSQSELPDQPFTVQVSGQNVQVTETPSPSQRTLGIPFHKGDTTIDIIGTVSVPEFGAIAALVLAIAIVSIIAVSSRTGLRLVPRY